MEKTSHDDVAVFVDFENVYVSVREKFDATPNFELIMDRCEDYGRIVIARAYADWYRYPRVTSALFANGVEPMYVPTYYYDRDAGRTGRPIKNSVDIHLCIDAMRTLYSQPHILKYVLVTGDRDFIPLVNAIRQQGKEVIIIGIGGAASAHLAQSGDEFLFYEQIADLKAVGQSQVQARMLAAQEQVARPQEGRDRNGERSDRSEQVEHPEQVERPERIERTARSERNARGDRRTSTPRIEQPGEAPLEEVTDAQELVSAAPEHVAPATELVAAGESGAVPAAPKSPYDTLVDAIELARKRGFVVNLGSLKVVMRELDSTFHESKVKDNNGKGFVKFKDFVKEAENRGKVQIFTNGTVTEVFLPGEDPYKMSQFAEDLTPQLVENELNSELAEQDQALPEVPAAAPEAPVAQSVEAVAEQLPVAPVAPTLLAEVVPALATADEESSGEPTRQVFADREWDVFRTSISQFSEPVRFTEIFNALRGLRNQEVVELTNNELKELVKQAINKGMLQRTGRGAKAYYRLSSQYRVPVAPTVDTIPDTDQASAASATTPPAPQAATPTAAQSSSSGSRRTRLYGLPVSDQPPGPAVAEQAPEAVAPTATEQAPTDVVQEALPASDVGAEVAVPAVEPQKRRSRRQKPAAEATPPTEPEQPVKATTKKGKGRQTNAEAPAPAPEATPEPATRNTRRRRRAPESNDETQG